MNLLKTFINSAVRQVGRDGGKVISNKVYGDRHSTPIRVVQSNLQSSESPQTEPEIVGVQIPKELSHIKSDMWGILDITDENLEGDYDLQSKVMEWNEKRLIELNNLNQSLNTQEEVENDSITTKQKIGIFFKIFLAIFLSFLLNFLAAVPYFLYGGYKLIDVSDSYVVGKRDGRYKNGFKQTGLRTYRKSPSEIKYNRILGIGYILASIIGLIIVMYI